MNKKVIYLKETYNYNDILKKQNNKIPLAIKKIIFLYKRIFNIITKKDINGNEVWIFPVKEKYSAKSIEILLKKYLIKENNIFLASNNLIENKIYDIMDCYKIDYITEEKIKKFLLIQILEYISNLQNKEINNLEVTILVNDMSSINMYLIEELAKQVKTLKIVSLNIYKFKKLEEKLYNEYGIPIQFSNSYKKSLEKSKIIINFDFSNIEINEYEIFDKAIIINCIKENIKLKSKLFNGIIVNSCDIEFNKEISDNFKTMQIYENFKKILLYACIIENEDNILKSYQNLKENKVKIVNLIGASGKINKKEFKNIEKSLTKIKKQSNI